MQKKEYLSYISYCGKSLKLISIWCSLFRTQDNELIKEVENFWKDQKAFAFDCEIGRTQLHMIENGKTNPRVLTLIKIANGLEISLSKLVDLS